MKKANEYKRERVELIESKYFQIFESIESSLSVTPPNGKVFLKSNGKYAHGIPNSVVYYEVVKVLEFYGYKIGDWSSSDTSFVFVD